MTAITLQEAAATYEDFYVPRFEIKAGGKAIAPAVLRDVVQVTYNDSTTEIDSVDITVNNWDDSTRSFKYVGSERSARLSGATPEEQLQRLFEPCAGEFELKLGYGSNLSSVVKGATTSLEPTFPAGAAPTLTVRALNVLFKLRTKQYRDHWSNKKISEVAEDIGRRNDSDGKKRFPLPIRIDRTAKGKEPKLDYIAQDNQYDIDFLLLEARKIGYVVYVDLEPQGRGKAPREVLHFGPSNALHEGVPAVSYELKWGISLIDFSPKLSTANQVKSVEVKGWNRQTNKAIKKKVDLRHPDIKINRDLLHLLDQDGCKPREEVIVDEPQYTPEQAERRALAVLSEKLKQMVEATGTTVGLPDLRAGRRVRIKGLGARFSGIYFVIKTTHTINDSGYLTKFTARREQGEEGEL
ncbi:phage late control D family protein [Massilia antarctica]|uniref:Phage late control D family protein n=1 Tax=Massilia antarctica TaxID=2765360 RepID=A0AA48W9Y0_9BURK|nr:contractile injection system protein, VgrG/Pvc8 family [Massilia antarctica]QPI48578.1 phage late control D family protein [Massilia antarctica]